MFGIQPTGQTTTVTFATDAQFTGLVRQTVAKKKTVPSLSLTGTADSQDQYSDLGQHSEPTSSTQPMEEEVEVSDQEAVGFYLQVSGKQTCQGDY